MKSKHDFLEMTWFFKDTHPYALVRLEKKLNYNLKLSAGHIEELCRSMLIEGKGNLKEKEGEGVALHYDHELNKKFFLEEVTVGDEHYDIKMCCRELMINHGPRDGKLDLGVYIEDLKKIGTCKANIEIKRKIHEKFTFILNLHLSNKSFDEQRVDGNGHPLPDLSFEDFCTRLKNARSRYLNPKNEYGKPVDSQQYEIGEVLKDCFNGTGKYWFQKPRNKDDQDLMKKLQTTWDYIRDNPPEILLLQWEKRNVSIASIGQARKPCPWGVTAAAGPSNGTDDSKTF
jgi:hypothetical protein